MKSMDSKFRVLLALTAIALGVAAVAGCSKKLSLLPVQTFRPTVTLTSAPIDTNVVCQPDPQRSCYSLTLNWIGYDPDGRVDHYIYAVDPPEAGPGEGDTLWITTTDSEKRLVFEAPRPSPGADSLGILRGFHTFVVAAVDNDGLIGPRADRTFFSFTIAPTVTIQSPRGDPAGNPIQLAPAIRINWSGTDVDGVFNSKPVRYKYILLGPNNNFPGGIEALKKPLQTGLLLRRVFAPNFDGWNDVSGDTTFVRFTNLVPGAEYLFAVVAFDEAGAYSPNFNLGGNVLVFKIGFASVFGPKITMFNDFFFYAYTGASYIVSPLTEVRLEVPAFQRITFRWFADPPDGADIRAYRWMLDGDVPDEHPRINEATDTQYWSTPSANVTSATVGPFTGGNHFFFIEAEDNTGLKSLGTIHFTVVAPTFERPLLIVKDTRLRPDGFRSDGTLAPLQGSWPNQAELDTFLFARGGYPWKKYPDGTTSPVGVLKGYTYDTLGTRIGIVDLNVPLLTLSKYRHVVWITDLESAVFANPGANGADPQTALRYMASPGRLNTLAAYVRQGGEVWALGGGIGYATNTAYNDVANDPPGGGYTLFSIDSPRREYGPGRFMFDAARWQGQFMNARASSGIIARQLGRFVNNPGVYASLPTAMEFRTQATDPVPPLRNTSSFYQFTFNSEYIHDKENRIVESVIGDPIDFQIDNFNGFDPPIRARWVSPDSLNTQVGQDAVTAAGNSGASQSAMRIITAGGGASDGDTVTRDLRSPELRDWSGMRLLKIAVKQDQPSSAVQWRLRMIDDRGGSSSALLPVTTTNTFQALQIPPTSFSGDSPTVFNPVRVARLQFELVQGTVAGTSWFDNIEVQTTQEGIVLDTLMAVENSSIPLGKVGATMTLYHGHDTQKPFLISGFAPWQFRRQNCVDLFDFVFQKLWGMSRTESAQLTARTGSMAPSVSTGSFLPPMQSAHARPVVRSSQGGGLRGTTARRSPIQEGRR